MGDIILSEVHSFSIYARQSHSPNNSLVHGDQYLKADSPLDQDKEFLDAIRVWMTLDVEPSEQFSKYDLESWTYLTYKNYMLVARMVSAKPHNQPQAYFAHARVWEQDKLPKYFNPGLYLGYPHAFEKKPWRDNDSGGVALELTEAVIPPIQELKNNQTALQQFTAHLLQALDKNYPLIIAAPLTEFACSNEDGRNSLYTLISFAYAILPAQPNYHCNIRIYTRNPQLLMMGQIKANLLVIPEDIAAKTLRITRDISTEFKPTLLNHKGELKGGEKLSEPFNHYAEAIVEQVLATIDLQTPCCLQIFKQYLADITLNGDKIDKAIINQAVQDAVNNALIRNRLENQPAQILSQLLQNQDAPFRQVLERQINTLEPQEFNKFSKQFEKSVISWWQESEPFSREKWHQLFQFTSYQPSLVSEDLINNLVLALPVEEIVTNLMNEQELYSFIQRELEQGDISRWQEQNAILVSFATSDFNRFQILIKKTLEKQLTPAWLNTYLNKNNQSQLLRSAEYLLHFPQKWQQLEHKNLSHPIKILYEQLKKLTPVPVNLRQALIEAGHQIKPSNTKPDKLQKNVEIYVRLADLIAHINHSTEKTADNPLVHQLWQEPELSCLKSDTLRYLFSVVQDKVWDGFANDSGQSLIDNTGEPKPIWGQNISLPDEEIADFLLKTYYEKLNILVLFQLSHVLLNKYIECADKLSEIKLKQAFCQIINHKIWEPTEFETHVKVLEGCTEGLLKINWWYDWFQTLSAIELNQAQKHRVALAWLKCPVWQNWNNNWQPPEPTLEAWRGVIRFLDDGLSTSEMQELVGQNDLPRWAKIVPFEDKQIEDLGGLVTELGAFIILAKAIRVHYQVFQNDCKTLIQKLQTLAQPKLSAFKLILDEQILSWLLDCGQKRPTLTVEQAALLYNHYPTPKTTTALEQTILTRFETEPAKTLTELLDSPANHIFQTNASFLNKLAVWLNSIESIQQLKQTNLLHKLNDWLKTVNKTEFKSSFQFEPNMPFANEVVVQYSNIATFIYSIETIQKIRQEQIINDVIKALCEGDTKKPGWDLFVKQIQQWHNQPTHSVFPKHPLLVLADSIYHYMRHNDNDKSVVLKKNGLIMLYVAIKKNPDLLEYDQVSSFLILPLINVVANLSGNGSLGISTYEIIRIASPQQRKNPQWWQALFQTVYHYKCYASIENLADRPKLALAYIYRNLTSSKWLDAEERIAFTQSWKKLSSNDNQ